MIYNERISSIINRAAECSYALNLIAYDVWPPIARAILVLAEGRYNSISLAPPATHLIQHKLIADAARSIEPTPEHLHVVPGVEPVARPDIKAVDLDRRPRLLFAWSRVRVV